MAGMFHLFGTKASVGLGSASVQCNLRTIACMDNDGLHRLNHSSVQGVLDIHKPIVKEK